MRSLLMQRNINCITSIPPPSLLRFKLVYSLNDLPDPVGNSITLEENTIYVIMDSIFIGDLYLSIPYGVRLSGITPDVSVIISNNSNYTLLFSKSIYVENISIVNINTGAAVRCEGLLPNDPDLRGRFFNTNFIGYSTIGVVQIHNCDTLLFVGSSWTDSGSLSYGVYCTGECKLVAISTSNIIDNEPGFTFLKVPFGTTISDAIVLVSNTITVDPAGFLSDCDPSAFNIESYIITSCRNVLSTSLSGINDNFKEAYFKSNSNITSTNPRSGFNVFNGASITILPKNIWTKAGCISNSIENQLFDQPLSNRIRYIGPKRRRFLVQLILTGSTSTNNVIIETSIFRNGIQVASFVTRDLSSGPAGDRISNLPLNAIIDLTTNDYIEVYIRQTNINPNVNFVWEDGQLIVSEIA